jgi:hypothetical protein
MLVATIRRERPDNTPALFFPDGTCYARTGEHSTYTRAYMHTRTRPAEPTDADCVTLVRAYSEPLRIVRRLPRE